MCSYLLPLPYKTDANLKCVLIDSDMWGCTSLKHWKNIRTDINLKRVMENLLTRAGEPEPSSVVSEAVGRDGVGTRSEVCKCDPSFNFGSTLSKQYRTNNN